MPSFIDLTGETYERLTVVERAPDKGGRTAWLCKCTCGNYAVVTSNMLRMGKVRSCGCIKTENCSRQAAKAGKRRAETLRKHSASGSRLYNVWKGMRQRCLNPNNRFFDNYGGRGICICDEWENFNSFQKWAYSHGYNETAKFGECTLDRIDNDGNYNPDNCRWVSLKVQANNRRRRQQI